MAVNLGSTTIELVDQINANETPSKHSYTKLTNEDINTLYGNDKVGWYYADGGNTCTNLPSSISNDSGFFLNVEKYGNYKYASTNNPCVLYVHTLFKPPNVYIRTSRLTYNGSKYYLNGWNTWQKNLQSVSYGESQTLTDSQKQQARTNIDAASTADIPTVNNGTLTIQKNGTTVATFSANQSGDVTANIEVDGSSGSSSNLKMPVITFAGYDFSNEDEWGRIFNKITGADQDLLLKIKIVSGEVLETDELQFCEMEKYAKNLDDGTYLQRKKLRKMYSHTISNCRNLYYKSESGDSYYIYTLPCDCGADQYQDNHPLIHNGHHTSISISKYHETFATKYLRIARYFYNSEGQKVDGIFSNVIPVTYKYIPVDTGGYSINIF